MDKISSAVASEVVQVTKDYNGTSVEELNKMRREKTREVLMRMEAELKELFVINLKEVTKKLAHKINNSTASMSAMPEGEKITSRAVAQIIINGMGGIAMQAIDD